MLSWSIFKEKITVYAYQHKGPPFKKKDRFPMQWIKEEIKYEET